MRSLVALTLSVLVLTGCGAGTSLLTEPASQAKMDGHLRGGQQPIVGAHIHVLAANSGGYGGANIAASSSIASVSLLDPAQTGSSDSIGAYVTSDASGSFSLSGRYTCAPGQQVYVYAQGGDTGAGDNQAAGLLGILGQCPSSGNFAGVIPSLEINEVTTVAAAYALAGFATDAAHVSTLNAPLSNAGLANAFHYANHLASVTDGAPVSPAATAKDALVVQTVNTLANVLAACINSSSDQSPACNVLFQNVDSSAHAGPPADTAAAAIYLAQNPNLSASNMSALFSLSTPTSPFTPALSAQPASFALNQTLSADTYSSLGDSITCGYVMGQPLSDCNTAFAYPSVFASAYNLPLTNAAYPGDQACDLWPIQVGPYALSPTLAGGTNLSTLMIGTNDANVKGPGAYESTFTMCDTAVVAWMAIPAESKSLAGSASLGLGWSQGVTKQAGPYITSSTPGTTASFQIATYGGPVMLWYVFQDGAAGEISYSVDGAAPTLLNTEASPAIATQNGGGGSVAVAITGALSGSVTAPVNHTVTIVNVEGTAYVIGVGTPPMTAFFGHPVLGVADVPNEGPNGPVSSSSAAAYSSDAMTIARQMQSYGLDVRYGSTHGYLTGQSSEFQADGVHPNSVGALHLFDGIQSILQP